jgi:hypothetical protein
MKATVNGVTVEGTPGEIAELMQAMKTPDTAGQDVAMLTPKQREVFMALVKHRNGAHYTALAEEIGLDADVVNSRLNELVRNHDSRIIKRVCSGTFMVVR